MSPGLSLSPNFNLNFILTGGGHWTPTWASVHYWGIRLAVTVQSAKDSIHGTKSQPRSPSPASPVLSPQSPGGGNSYWGLETGGWRLITQPAPREARRAWAPCAFRDILAHGVLSLASRPTTHLILCLVVAWVVGCFEGADKRKWTAGEEEESEADIGEVDAEADADVDAGAQTDADAQADVEAQADADVETDADADAEPEAEAEPIADVDTELEPELESLGDSEREPEQQHDADAESIRLDGDAHVQEQEAEIALPDLTGKVCSSEGWCWMNPLPHGIDIEDVWGADPEHVWAVDRLGGILFWDGTSWTPSRRPDGSWLSSVWGTDAEHVWAVGWNSNVRQLILHWDGHSWEPQYQSDEPGDLYDIWGTGPDRVWVVGHRGTYPQFGLEAEALRWDGNSWSSMLPNDVPGSLRGIHGTSATDLWAVGSDDDAELILHWGGSQWTPVHNGPEGSGTLRGVWSESTTNAWAIGPRLLRWDGVNWKDVADAPLDISIAITGFEAHGEVVIAGRAPGDSDNSIAVFDGSTWTMKELDCPCNAFWLTSRNDGWIVGDLGEVCRLEQGISYPRTSEMDFKMNDVWAESADSVWLLTIGPNDSGAPSANRFFRWDGSQWGAIGEIDISEGKLVRIRGSDNENVWAVGYKTFGWWPPNNTASIVAYFDGSSWRLEDIGEEQVELNSVWPLDHDRVWAAGDNRIYVRNNGHWQLQHESGIETNSLFGLSQSQIWAVGGGKEPSTLAVRGAWMMYNGTAWGDPVYTVTDIHLDGVWGLRPDSLWSFGTDGSAIGACDSVILHYDGAQWEIVHESYSLCPRDVWGSSDSSVYFAGDRGNIVRWNGSELIGDYNHCHTDLNAIDGIPGYGVWAVGDNGVILFRPER